MNNKYNLTFAHDNDLDIYWANDLFDSMLDETHDVITICGMHYDPSRALKKLDPVAYRCAVLDYIDSIRDEYTEIDCSGDDIPLVLTRELEAVLEK